MDYCEPVDKSLIGANTEETTNQRPLSSLISEYLLSLLSNDGNEQLVAQEVKSEDASSQSEDETNLIFPTGLITQSDKLHEQQAEMSQVMTKKRAYNVKHCKFKQQKEWVRDYLTEHDFDQIKKIS